MSTGFQADAAGRGELGALVSMHGFSRMGTVALSLFAAVFIGAGALLMFALAQVERGEARLVPGAEPWFRCGAATCVAVGGLAALGLLLARSRGLRVYVHENAVRTVRRGRERIDRYEDIEDLYHLDPPAVLINGAGPGGVLAFRNPAREDWVVVKGKLSRYAQLQAAVRARQVRRRGELLLPRLLAGDELRFRYFSDRQSLRKEWWGVGRLRTPENAIVLSARELRIGDRALPLARLGRVDRGEWLELYDIDGRPFHQFHHGAVLSQDLLLELLREARVRGLQAADAGMPVSASVAPAGLAPVGGRRARWSGLARSAFVVALVAIGAVAKPWLDDRIRRLGPPSDNSRLVQSITGLSHEWVTIRNAGSGATIRFNPKLAGYRAAIVAVRYGFDAASSMPDHELPRAVIDGDDPAWTIQAPAGLKSVSVQIEFASGAGWSDIVVFNNDPADPSGKPVSP